MGVFHIFKIVQMVPNRAKHRNLIGFANMVLQTCQKWSEAAKILLQQVLVLIEVFHCEYREIFSMMYQSTVVRKLCIFWRSNDG